MLIRARVVPNTNIWVMATNPYFIRRNGVFYNHYCTTVLRWYWLRGWWGMVLWWIRGWVVDCGAEDWQMRWLSRAFIICMFFNAFTWSMAITSTWYRWFG